MSSPVTPDDDLSGRTLVNDYGAAEILYDARRPVLPNLVSPFTSIPDPESPTSKNEAAIEVEVNVRGTAVSLKAATECHACNTSVKVNGEKGHSEVFCSTECTSSAETICAQVSRAILSGDREAALLQRDGEEAQIALNVMQKMMETNRPQKWRISSLILKLSIRSNRLPASLVVNDVTRLDKECVAGGGFADIFRGEYKGKPVALKRLRVYRPSDNVGAWKDFYREAIIWKNLNHAHVLPLLGIDNSTFKQNLCMVIPWMEYGNVRHVIEKLKVLDEKKFSTPKAPIIQVHKWLREIAFGLAYLHEESIIHGDLRGVNILIDDNWGVRLTDFGMAVYAEGTSNSYGSMRGGNPRWMAPELIDPVQFFLVSDRPTNASDVFSFACCCVELFSGKIPYDGCGEGQVMKRVPEGLRPERPTAFVGEDLMSDDLWNVLTRCWTDQPANRPSAQEVVQLISEVCDNLPGINEDSGISSEFSKGTPGERRKRIKQKQELEKQAHGPLHTMMKKVTDSLKVPPFVETWFAQKRKEHPDLDKLIIAAEPLGRLLYTVFVHNFLEKAIFLFVCLMLISMFTGGSSHVYVAQLLWIFIQAVEWTATFTVWLVFRLCCWMMWMCWIIFRFMAWSLPKSFLRAIGFEVWHIPVYIFVFAMPKRARAS